MRIRVDFGGLAFGLMLLLLFAAPWLRGLFFEPDLFPALMVVAAALVLLALEGWNRRTPWWDVLAWADGLVVALVLLYALSFFPSVDRRSALVGALKMSAYAAVYVLAVRYALRPWSAGRLAGTLVVAGSGVALFGWLTATGWVAFPGAEGPRLTSTLQYPNALAGLMIVTLCLAATLWAQAGAGQPLYAAAHLLGLATLLGTQSRGGWLVYGLVAVLLVILAPAESRWRLFVFHAASTTAALVVGAQALPRLGEPSAKLAVVIVVAACILFAAGDWFVGRLDRWLRLWAANPTTATILRVTAVAYVAILVTWAAAYYLSAGPALAARVVPVDVSQRFASIGADEHSFRQRLEASRDAWTLMLQRPWLGAGAGGWNALYHQVQHTPYWTTEVHNHYLQTGIETGVFGLLAFIGIWVALGLAVARALPRLEGGRALLLWGVATALLGQLLHAAWDFDLSLPALSMWAWALGGSIRGTWQRVEGSQLPGIRLAERPWGRWAGSGLVLAAVAVLIAYPAWRLNAAGVVGAAGARALLEQRWDEAEAAMVQAHRLDPWNGTYALDLAQARYALWLQGRRGGQAGPSGGDGPGLTEVTDPLAAALRVQPYSPRLRDRALQLYLLLGQEDAALEQAEALAWLLPREVTAYVPLLELLVQRAEDALRNRNSAVAAESLDRLMRLRVTLFHLQQQLDAARNPGRLPPGRPVLPADAEFAFGRAEYLRARFELAQNHLTRAAQERGEHQAAARVWLAATHYVSGRLEEAQELRETFSEADQRRFEQLLALHGF